MVKFIELTPEWILSELSQSLYADGKGTACIDTDSASDASWIKLALNTLLIPFEEKEYGDNDMTFIDFEFNINDIKDNCPNLYEKMKDMDTKNKIYNDLNLN